ncbi:MAG: SUMF1/EgtB/PvdO family nonheme iron enzyme [Ruminococcus sp.]|nr:SUMF1/EgtB/PvdO family nonheme iron enzyme [Ruminococcus sp.]
MASNFDLSNLALKSAFPTNSILTDDKGLPSVMVYIPKFKMSEVIDGASDSTHPAFIVDGVEISGIYISKYQNITYNSRAYSLPGEDPRASVTVDSARTYSESKGTGWHLMSAMEWGAIALWCMKNGWLPYGNNNYGLDTRETIYKGIPTYTDSSGNICRIATGSGPVEYSHNKQLDGIYDLNGNIWEWTDGMRFVYGELQILANNNSADSANSKLDTSSAWMAIDGTTGELIEPDGSGTTSNSLKLDYISSKWTWITGTISSVSDTSRSCAFVYVTADDTVCDTAKELLYALALLPSDASQVYDGDFLWLNNAQAERSPKRGGRWNTGTGAGIFAVNCDGNRTDTNTSIGFRCAYYEA